MKGSLLDRWNRKFSTKTSTSGLVRTRNFAPLKNKSRGVLSMHKDRTHVQSRRHFSRCPITTECKRPCLKKSPAVTLPCYSTIASSPSCLPSLKLHPLTEGYIPASLTCHHQSVNFKFQGTPRSPCFPIRFLPVLHPRSVQELPSPKIHQKRSPPLKCPRSFKLSAMSSSFSTKCSSRSRLLSQNLFFPKSRRNKPRKIFAHRGWIHRRGFRSSALPLRKSTSSKPSTCKKVDEICKSTEKTGQCGKPCKKKNDVCRLEKVKCDQQRYKKEKTEKKIAELACRKTCLGRGKCELPRTVPPPKMEYEKVTCPPPKFAKPNPCPPIPERFQKDDRPRIETRQVNGQMRQICVPPPLPKPPYGPVALCPCLPPRKLHPGPCPCYEGKGPTRPSSLRPCPLKKKYPCPTVVHYCPPQKKPCNLKRDGGCEYKRRKKISQSVSRK